MHRLVIAAGAIAVLLLAGCTADTMAAPTPTTTSVPPRSVTWSATGTGEEQPGKITSVKGTRSILLTVTCAGDGVIAVSVPSPVELVTARTGGCANTHQWQLPVDYPRTEVSVTAPEGAVYVIEARLSRERIQRDPGVTASCADWSDIESQLFNADVGLQPEYAAWDAAGWREHVDAALDDLRDAAKRAPAQLRPLFVAEATRLSSPDLAPGHADLGDPIRTAIGSRCSINDTPIAISAQFGG